MLQNEHLQFIANAKRRMFMLVGFKGILFVLLGMRLFYLQMMKGGAYRDLAENNRISLQPEPALRGRIFGRNGEILVENSPNYCLEVIPELSGGLERLLYRLQPYLDLTQEDLEIVLKRARSQRSFLPLNVQSHLSWEEMSGIEARIHTFPGTELRIHPLRYYPYGEFATHFLGYLGDVSESERKMSKNHHYRSGDLIGKAGVEKSAESRLRGKEGVREMEVNAFGRQVRQLSFDPPQPGEDIHLTLDVDLQMEAERMMVGKNGSIVAMDPSNGEVLAMVSQPSYDPNIFIRGMTNRQWRELIVNPKMPLTNKSVQGQYPPGSTFKMAVALAGLAGGHITPNDQFYCPGYLTRQEHRFYCWKFRGHGSLDLKQALAQSCDVFFYKLAEKVGIDAIEHYGRGFGFGEISGIALPGERAGLMPSRSWKLARYRKPWYPGETLITAIGQGYMLATPLQLANMIATIANGGTLYRPVIERQNKPQLFHSKHKLNLRPEHLAYVREGLEEVVKGRLGTAKKVQPENLRVAGKTGTSQVVRHRRNVGGKVIQTDNESYKDHALFVAYAPTENPKIALSVVVEHGGSGSSSAAPIAMGILERYFEQKSDQNKT
ncbi:MAG: penicillin-binding protein 2 [Magnetococcus sp. DMHC-6]